MNVQFQPVSEQLVQRWETAAGYYIGIDQLLCGRTMLRECFQSHPSDFPEVTWTGTQFRILPDEET